MHSLHTLPLTAQSTDTSVEVLAARAAKGDTEALGTLYALHAAATLRWIRAKITDVHSAEDINAETWVVVVRSIRSYQQRAGSAGWLGWLFTITRTKMLDWLRAQSRRSARESREDWSEGEWNHPVAPRSEGPEACVERAAVAHHVKVVLATLPEAHVQVLTLRFWQQMTVAETAAAMGKSPSWVTTTQHRAMTNLRSRVTEHDRDLATSA